MLDSVLISDWTYPIFFIFFTVVITGVIMIASAFIIEGYRDKKEQKDRNNNEYHAVTEEKNDSNLTGMIGLIGIVLVMFSLVFGLIYSSVWGYHVSKAIINDIKETYNVTIYDHEGSQ